MTGLPAADDEEKNAKQALLEGKNTMAKFIIEPHFRLQEWVAEEKDYFRKEGLDYEFRELMRATDGKIHDKGSMGAFLSFEEGR
jgi:hypothetical protein